MCCQCLSKDIERDWTVPAFESLALTIDRGLTIEVKYPMLHRSLAVHPLVVNRRKGGSFHA